jgi:hypothetical protein
MRRTVQGWQIQAFYQIHEMRVVAERIPFGIHGKENHVTPSTPGATVRRDKPA